MRFEGTFWLLWEEEPIDLKHTRLFDFRSGEIFDGRTGAHRGSYSENADGVTATFSERNGQQIVVFQSGWTLRKGAEIIPPPAFDPAADSYVLRYSTAAYEEYAASLPANDHETDEEKDDRYEMEIERFGMRPTFGYAYRDCAEVREWGEANQRDYEAGCRRAEMHAVEG
jgi:hypothetical protein